MLGDDIEMGILYESNRMINPLSWRNPAYRFPVLSMVKPSIFHVSTVGQCQLPITKHIKFQFFLFLKLLCQPEYHHAEKCFVYLQFLY